MSEATRRSAVDTLSSLTTPLIPRILDELALRPTRGAELRRATDLPAQATLRAKLNRLAGMTAVEKRRHNSFPGVIGYALTPAGDELLTVRDTVSWWLEGSPGGPLELGESGASAALKALVDGWSSSMLHALAAEPLALTELDRRIAPLSYPALERRLSAMRLAGLVEAHDVRGHGRGTPYRATAWLRHAAAPLAAAAHWERHHRPETTPPLHRCDLEAIFTLAAPLLRSPRSLPDVRGANPPVMWLDAIVEGDASRLELDGDRDLVRRFVDDLHRSVFGAMGRGLGRFPAGP